MSCPREARTVARHGVEADQVDAAMDARKQATELLDVPGGVVEFMENNRFE